MRVVQRSLGVLFQSKSSFLSACAACAFALAACDPAAPAAMPGDAALGAVAVNPAQTVDAGFAPAPIANEAGSSVAIVQDAATGAQPDASMQAPAAVAGRASSGKGSLPCDVADVLKRRCQSCHARAPVAGVPMALVTREDLLAPAVTRAELSVAQLSAARLRDTQRPMPPNQLLPAAELAILDAWRERGMPAGVDPSCAPGLDNADAGVGPPPDSTCYTLKAHGQSQAGDK